MYQIFYLMYYYLIIALQAYCIYHLWKHRTSYYWVFVILFLPVIGCLLYLYMHAIKKKDVENIQNELVNVINPSKKIRNLEESLEFADTFQNRVNLADAYMDNRDFGNAILHYEKALNDDFDDDFYVCEQLIIAYFETDQFDEAVLQAEKIKDDPAFEGAKCQFFYGLSLDRIDRTEEGITELLHINKRYSFYNERVILAKFLLHHIRIEQAKEILNDILEESKHMTRDNRKQYGLAISETERLLSEL